MPDFDPQLLQKWTSGKWAGPKPGILRGFSIDTRSLQPGDVFVALKSDKRDGHEFLEEATTGGAAAAIVERVNNEAAISQLQVHDTLAALQKIAGNHRRQFTGTVIGITGSCGKTSTKDMLALLLGGGGVHSSPGNYNNHLGVPLALLGIDQSNHSYAVIEAGSSRSGELKPLAEIIAPAYGIITLVAEAHMEWFGSIEAVAGEKAELGHAVHPDGKVIFPQQCLQYGEFRNFRASSLVASEQGEPELNIGDAGQIIYSAEPTTDGDAGGWRLRVKLPDNSEYTFTLPAMSKGMVRNAVPALVLALELGVKHGLAQERLLQWRPGRFRGEIHSERGINYYIDCYNANPTSMLDTFDAFQRTFAGEQPRLYLLGCMAEMGERSGEWHKEVGRALVLRPQDRACIIGEQAEDLRAGILEAGGLQEQVAVLQDLDEVRGILNKFQGSVLLKGSRDCRLESVIPGKLHKPVNEFQKAC